MKKAIFPLIALLTLIAKDAIALDAEYFTYNGFTAIANAWRFIALVFGNNDYKALFFSVIVIGMLIGAATVYFRLLAGGGKGSSLSWAWNIGFGVILYMAFFLPKGSLYVYDKVLNRYEAISGVPDGLVAVAGVLSAIENGVVDIIQTSGAPLSFYDSAGGVGFDLLLKGANPIENMGEKMKVGNVKNFIQQCVMFEMTRPGTTLTADIIATTNQNLIDLFSSAQNDAIFINWVFADGSMANVSCTEAYNNLRGEWTLPALDTVVSSKCASAGFNVSNASELQRCKEIMEQTLNVAMGAGGMSANQYFQQASMATILRHSTIGGDLDQGIIKSADSNMKSSMMGVGLVANEYLPIIRAVITAVSIGMVPFVVIFLPTPIGAKAINIVFGFFLWLTAWGITDAITHQMAVDYANEFFEQARQNNIGYAAMMLIPDAASRTMAMFGVVRTAGIMLATIITTTLIQFGGHVMGMLAGQFSGTLQGGGQHAGAQVATPQGAASAVSGFTVSRATLANQGRFNFMESSGAAEFAQASSAKSSLTHSGHLADGGPVSAGVGGTIAGNAQGTAGAKDTMTQMKTSGLLGGNEQYVGRLSDYFGGQGAGSAKFAEMERSALGFGSDAKGQELLKRFHDGGNVIDKEMAGHLNQKYAANGQELFKEGMQVKYGIDSGSGQITNLSGTRQLKRDEYSTAFGMPFRLEQGGVETAYADGRRTFEGHFSDEKGHGGHIAHHGSVTFGKNGDMKNAEGNAGFQAMFRRNTVSEYKDLHTSDTGVRTTSGSKKEHFDVDTRRTDHGHDINHALQMVMNSDSSIFSGLSHARSSGGRKAEIAAITEALGDDLKHFISRSGISQDYAGADAKMSGEAGFRTPLGGASVGGSAHVGGDRRDVYNTNLLNREINERLTAADNEARQQGFAGAEHSDYMLKNFQSHIGEVMDKVSANDPNKFGASAPGEFGMEVLKSGWEGAKSLYGKVMGDHKK